MKKEDRLQFARILASGALLAVAWALPLEGWARLLAFLVPYALCGWDVVFDALKNLAHGELFDEKFLMTLATAGALALGDYPEAVAVMLFYQLGEFCQDMAVDKSKRDIAALMDIRPDSATVLRGGAETRVPPEDVKVGEVILVRPGEKIPLDGVIEEGESTLDTAALTGESLPREVKPGDAAVSGAINLTGVLRVRTSSVYGESTVAKILELVEHASEKKARAEGFITRFARVYTPCVVGAALLMALVPPLAFGQSWGEWLNRALIFLVVSCPCALVVSVPLTFFAGLGSASRKGVLVKGASYLETLSKVKTMVFDKTGTLTKGSFAVTAVHPAQVSEAQLLDIAALAESRSSHPIALSIVRAHGGHIDPKRVTSVEERAGRGVTAVIDGRAVSVGNGKLMDEVGAKWHPCHQAGTVIHIASGSEYLGHVVISDELKPDSRQAVAELKALGVERVVMLTGDAKAVGEAVGAELGVDDTKTELLPEGKVREVEALLGAGSPLAFVGDGINDAPVLTRADVGVAMGALGSDAAIEAADVVLMDDQPGKLPVAVRIARKTMAIVRQNIAFALGVKAAVLLLGAFGIAGMWFAVFADVGVTMLAVLNALRAS